MILLLEEVFLLVISSSGVEMLLQIKKTFSSSHNLSISKICKNYPCSSLAVFLSFLVKETYFLGAVCTFNSFSHPCKH